MNFYFILVGAGARGANGNLSIGDGVTVPDHYNGGYGGGGGSTVGVAIIPTFSIPEVRSGPFGPPLIPKTSVVLNDMWSFSASVATGTSNGTDGLTTLSATGYATYTDGTIDNIINTTTRIVSPNGANGDATARGGGAPAISFNYNSSSNTNTRMINNNLPNFNIPYIGGGNGGSAGQNTTVYVAGQSDTRTNPGNGGNGALITLPSGVLFSCGAGGGGGYGPNTSYDPIGYGGDNTLSRNITPAPAYNSYSYSNGGAGNGNNDNNKNNPDGSTSGNNGLTHNMSSNYNITSTILLVAGGGGGGGGVGLKPNANETTAGYGGVGGGGLIVFCWGPRSSSPSFPPLPTQPS
jgi:hypothetical protein